MTDVLYLLIGLLLGGLGMWLVARALAGGRPTAEQLSQAQADARVANEKILLVQNEIQETKQALAAATQEKTDLARQLGEQKGELKYVYQELDKKANEVVSLGALLTDSFKNLANEILKEKTDQFEKENKAGIENLLKPFHDKIIDFQKKIEETHIEGLKNHTELGVYVKNLAQLQQNLSQEATSLTNALKGQSKTQGNWGEVILESILEKSGLRRGHEFLVQPSYTTEEGKRANPDVVVVFPNNRSVIIDSKVTLIAYERFSNASDKQEMEKALKEHLQSLRNHIKDLSAKNYQQLYQLNTLDFVFLFMPVEPAYFLALQADPEIVQYAQERNIALIGPTNLIAMLKLVENLWKQQFQKDNAQEIARQAGALYDKFVGFYTNLEKVGKSMNAAKAAYSEAMKQLYEGKDNLVRKAERLKELGADSSNTLPLSLLDRATQDED